MTRAGGPIRGQAVVEFALVVPLVLIIVLALVDLGRAVFVFNAITNGAREGARLAIVNQDPASVRQRAEAQSPGSEAAADVAFYEPGPSLDPEENDACEPPAVGCLAVVTVHMELRPIISAVIPLPSGGGFAFGTFRFTLRARSVLPVEFACPTTQFVEYDTAAECPKQP